MEAVPVHGRSWDWIIFKVLSNPDCSVIPRCIVSISFPVTITKPGLTDFQSVLGVPGAGVHSSGCVVPLLGTSQIRETALIPAIHVRVVQRGEA